jgi:hypothetical protein
MMTKMLSMQRFLSVGVFISCFCSVNAMEKVGDIEQNVKPSTKDAKQLAVLHEISRMTLQEKNIYMKTKEYLKENSEEILKLKKTYFGYLPGYVEEFLRKLLFIVIKSKNVNVDEVCRIVKSFSEEVKDVIQSEDYGLKAFKIKDAHDQFGLKVLFNCCSFLKEFLEKLQKDGKIKVHLERVPGKKGYWYCLPSGLLIPITIWTYFKGLTGETLLACGIDAILFGVITAVYLLEKRSSKKIESIISEIQEEGGLDFINKNS